MFDIGFPELLLISVVALLVIGPEKLPETIRTISLWIGRIQRSFSNLKHEIETEIRTDEIRTQLHNENIMADLAATKNDIEEISRDVNTTIQRAESGAANTAKEQS